MRTAAFPQAQARCCSRWSSYSRSPNQLRRLNGLSIEWVTFSEDHAAQAAMLWPLIRGAGLSLADRACLALAISRDLTGHHCGPRLGRAGLPGEVVLTR